MPGKKKLKKWGGARTKSFTPAQVRKMRRQYDVDGLSVAEIARKAGAKYDVVSRVLLRKSYPHVADETPKKKTARKKLVAKTQIVPVVQSQTREEFEEHANAEAAKNLLPPPSGVLSKQTHFLVGDRIADCDPRRNRTGEIVQIDLDGSRALVKWSTGEQTAIASAKVHRKPASRKGYRVIAERIASGAVQAETITAATYEQATA